MLHFQATCAVRKLSRSVWLFVLSESSLLHGTEYRHTRFCIVAFPSNLRGKGTVTLIVAFRTFRKQPAARYGIPAVTSTMHLVLSHSHATCTVRKLSRSIWLFVLSESSLLHGTEYQQMHFALPHFQATCIVRKLSRSCWLFVLSESRLLHGTEYRHTHFCIVAFPSNLDGKETVTLILAFRAFRKQPAARYEIPARAFCIVAFPRSLKVRKLSRTFWPFLLSERSLLHGTEYQHTHFVLSHFQATCTVRKLSRSFWLFVLSESSLLHGTEYRHTHVCIVAFPSKVRGTETVTPISGFRTFRKQPAARYCTLRKLSRSFRFFVLSENSLVHSTEFQHTHFVLSHVQATCIVKKLSRSCWLFVLSESSLLARYGIPVYCRICKHLAR